jgi:cytoskeletal protein CcmA (bactofilin family)
MPKWWQRFTSSHTKKPAKQAAKQALQTAAKQRGQVSEPFTFIHQGTVIVGNVQVPGRARIHGEVHGNVNVQGLLEIAASATIDGHYIYAENIKILGQVHADVWVTGNAEIWRGGSLTGNLYAAQLDIEQGATFIGSSDMRPAGYDDMPPAFYAHLGTPEDASQEDQEDWHDMWLEPATPADITVAAADVAARAAQTRQQANTPTQHPDDPAKDT